MEFLILGIYFAFNFVITFLLIASMEEHDQYKRTCKRPEFVAFLIFTALPVAIGAVIVHLFKCFSKS